ncbi:MAG: NADH-quinone oxidoreductase subunit C [Nitrospirae bacterium]|nr:NADH-quinone oxidoreductase subunit C [Nitrospirota bacterium]
MEAREIAEAIKEIFQLEVKDIQEFRGQVSVIIKKERIHEIMKYLYDTAEFCFDYLQDLCGVDYLDKKEKRFEIVYHLYSFRHRHMIRIKAEVPEDDMFIDSVVCIWTGANWHEREAYDMYGIVFKGHPDLRRILMPEDWEGFPLRKDYPLRGPEGWEWKGIKEIEELHTNDDERGIKTGFKGSRDQGIK